MDLRLEKYALVEKIMKISDAKLLDTVKKLLESGTKSQEGRISIEQYNQELEAEREYNEIGGFTVEEILKEMEA